MWRKTERMNGWASLLAVALSATCMCACSRTQPTVTVQVAPAQRAMVAPKPARRDGLDGSLDDPRRLWVAVTVDATSTYGRAGARGPFEAKNILHSGPEAAWCEGNPASAVGESIRLHFDHPIPITQVALDAGVHIDVPRDRRARIFAADVTLDDGRRFHLEQSPFGGFYADVGGAPAGAVTVTITKVDRPDGVACLSRVVMNHGRPNVYELFGGDAHTLDALSRDVGALQAAFSACDGARFEALVDFPIVRTSRVKETIAGAADLRARCLAHPSGYMDAGTTTDLLRRIRFEGDDRATISMGMWTLRWTGTRWHLAELWNFDP